MATRKEYKITLISKELLNSDTCYLGFECPEIAGTAVPGQFVNISAGTMFLKRPFGIASVDRVKGTFYIGVKVVGKGTEIASLKPVLMVDCLALWATALISKALTMSSLQAAERVFSRSISHMKNLLQRARTSRSAKASGMQDRSSLIKTLISLRQMR